MLELPTGSGAAPNYAVDFRDGRRVVNGTGPVSFVLTVPNEDRLEHLMRSGTLEAAVAFVNGEIDVSGDIVAAIRTLRSRIHPQRFSTVMDGGRRTCSPGERGSKAGSGRQPTSGSTMIAQTSFMPRSSIRGSFIRARSSSARTGRSIRRSWRNWIPFAENWIWSPETRFWMSAAAGALLSSMPPGTIGQRPRAARSVTTKPSLRSLPPRRMDSRIGPVFSKPTTGAWPAVFGK